METARTRALRRRGPMGKGSEPCCCGAWLQGAWSPDTAAQGWGTQVTRALGKATGLRGLGIGRPGRPGRGSCPASLGSPASHSISLSSPVSSSANPGNTGLASQSGGPWYPAPQRQERSVGTAGSAPDHLSPAVRRLRPHLRRAQVLWPRGWKPLPQPWGALGGRQGLGRLGGRPGLGERSPQSPPLPVAGRVYF